VHLLETGDLLAIFGGHAIVKLDATSRLVWSNRIAAHHDLEVTEDGEIYVLTREPRLLEWVNPDEPVLEDYVSILTPDGVERERVSLLDCLRNSGYGGIWNEAGDNEGDLLHTNTLEILDGRIADRVPAFRSGNLLTSFLHLDAIAVVDLTARKISWWHRGEFRRQHDPTVLTDGNLLLFDNGEKSSRRSQVLEIDPATGEVVWAYRGGADTPLWTRTCGLSQRLRNGNTLITESDNGRAFEVDPDGTIVWEYVNPHRAGENGEFIATLFEVRRLPEDFPTPWLPDRSSASSR
jgi:outer membrane protein assembly factor BamB